MSEKDNRHPLSGFIYETACGGAIKHLADLSYSANEIGKTIDYPVPLEKIKETIWEHYVASGVICLEKPDKKVFEKVDYIKVTNEYGHSSFQRIVTKVDESSSVYVPCDFGIRIRTDGKAFAQYIGILASSDQEYIMGINWPEKVVYHKLNERMKIIADKLGIKYERE